MSIKVHGRFATARDTARTLGVSDSRARALINTIRSFTDPREGGFKRRRKQVMADRVLAAKKKRSVTYAEVRAKKAKASNAKTHR